MKENIIKKFNKSIKWRLTCIFALVMICCIGSILLFNTLFLEKLYVNQRKEMLVKTYEIIDNGLTDAFDKGLSLQDLLSQSRYYIPRVDGPGDAIRRDRQNWLNENNESSFTRMLRELQSIYNISVIFVDEKNNKYSIFNNNQRFESRINSYIFDSNKEDDITYKVLEDNGKYKVAIHQNDFSNFRDRARNTRNNRIDNNSSNKKPDITPQPTSRNDSDIECFGFLSDNVTQFFMTTPLMSIREPIKLFNGVLIFISLIIIVVGSFIIYFTSLRLSKPIVEMADVSKKMSNMDFNSKYEGKDEDEIGMLGYNMNEMSHKLEKTIKELKNANIMLKADVEQKEKLDNMRTEFIANVSHELKTPIALIQGYAEGLEGDIAKTKEDRNYYANVIKEEANKMSMMVKQLLDLMALEKEIDDVNIERINLKDIIDKSLDSHDILIKKADINLSSDIKDDIYVWVDSFRLEEVITNYITNAIRYVDDKKIIKLWTENIDDKLVRLYVYNTANKLSDEQIENVWEKFYKVDKARTRMYGGTGLGLSIVKAIAKKMGTACGCKNVDDGVVFYFDLHTK